MFIIFPVSLLILSGENKKLSKNTSSQLSQHRFLDTQFQNWILDTSILLFYTERLKEFFNLGFQAEFNFMLITYF